MVFLFLKKYIYIVRAVKLGLLLRDILKEKSISSAWPVLSTFIMITKNKRTLQWYLYSNVIKQLQVGAYAAFWRTQNELRSMVCKASIVEKIKSVWLYKNYKRGLTSPLP